MTDRRTTLQIARKRSGRCIRCGDPLDRVGARCHRCTEIVNAHNRQRYRPGKPAELWTMAYLARFTALELRGLV